MSPVSQSIATDRTGFSRIAYIGRVRWQYHDPGLVWLVVAAFAAHVVEEYLAGFPGWFAHLSGRPLPVTAFLWINGVALPVIVVTAWVGLRRGWEWIPIALATVVLVNGVAHVLGSLATGTYSPGLLTGISCCTCRSASCSSSGPGIRPRVRRWRRESCRGSSRRWASR